MFKVKMLNFKKNKKGVEAAWGTIIMIIAVIASVIIIIWVLKSSASKVDEELQVDLCRISNEILVGTEEASPWYLHGHSPRVCSTIWRVEKNLQIPTIKYEEKYETATEAAEAEVMDLMAKCWYMWLEGSDPDVFPKEGIGLIGRLWGGKGCYICYAFKLSKEVEGFNFDDLINSMKKRTYTAIDLSDKCAPNGGGFLKDDENWHCGPPVESGWKVVKSKKDEDCCIRENILDECGNKGGKCSDKPDGEFEFEYNKWSCPETNQKCYVKEESHYSYYKYITKYGARGGEVVTHYENLDLTGVIAISFHSYRDDKEGTFIELSSLEYAKRTSNCKID